MKLLVQLLLFAVACGGLTVLLVAIVNRTHAYGWNRKLVHVLTLACGLLLLIGVWPLVQFSAGASYPSTLPGLSAALVSAVGWTAVTVALVALAHNAWRWFHPERRSGILVRRATPMDLGGTTTADWLAPGVPQAMGRLPGNEVLKPHLVEIELLVPDLPAAFEGLTVVHLSDLHMSGRIARAYFDCIVEASNALAPDVVAITGDIVERTACLDWVNESLAHLHAKQAKLFVLGNHDVKAAPAETRARLVTAGFVDVGGKLETLSLNGGSCVVAGNEMPWFGPPPDLAGLPPRASVPDELRIALLHTPDHFGWAQRGGFHLALAGHNHGGQIRFPVLGAVMSPSIYGTRYAGGVFSRSGTVMHVSPGTSSLTPVRWNCPPELNHLTLRGG